MPDRRFEFFIADLFEEMGYDTTMIKTLQEKFQKSGDGEMNSYPFPFGFNPIKSI
jgi:hypothetical protein